MRSCFRKATVDYAPPHGRVRGKFHVAVNVCSPGDGDHIVSAVIGGRKVSGEDAAEMLDAHDGWTIAGMAAAKVARRTR